jgi:hypothetical protein
MAIVPLATAVTFSVVPDRDAVKVAAVDVLAQLVVVVDHVPVPPRQYLLAIFIPAPEFPLA